jgi:hypothetical protein
MIIETVQDLILELQKLPPEKRIFIDDADTNWLMPMTLDHYTEGVTIVGRYEDARGDTDDWTLLDRPCTT